MVAVADVGGDVTVFDVATRKPLAQYAAQAQVDALEFSPDSDRLVIAGFDLTTERDAGVLRVIDARTGRAVVSAPLPLPGDNPRVTVAFAMDGQTMTVGYCFFEADTPALLRRFDANSGSAIGRVHSLRDVRGPQTSLSTTDGRMLFVGDHTTVAVDDATLRVVRRYHSGGQVADIDADGTTVAILGAHGEIRLLNLGSGQTRTIRRRQSDPAFTLDISPDGTRLATSGDGGDVTVWDVSTGQQLERLAGQVSDTYVLRFGEGGRTLYGGGRAGGAIAWDVSGARRLGAIFPTGFVVIPQDEFPPAFAVSPSGKELAVVRLDGKIDLVDAESLRTRKTVQAFDRTPATAIEYSPSGKLLAVAGMRGVIGLFDASTGDRVGEYVSTPSGQCADPGSNFTVVACLERTIQVLAFVAEDRLFAASIGGALRHWDLARREPVGATVQLPKYVTGLAASPDASTIAVTYGYANAAQGVAIIDTRSGERVTDLTTDGEPRSVAFSPDGNRLAVGQTTGDVLFWETENWRRTDLTLAQRGFILSVGFSPDGRTLATSTREGTVALWDATTGAQIGDLLPAAPNRIGPPGPPWVTSRFTPTALGCSPSMTPATRSAGSSSRRRGAGTPALSPAEVSRPRSGMSSCPTRSTARPATRSAVVRWSSMYVHPLPRPPEDAQDLRGAFSRAAEPVRQDRLELDSLPGAEHEILVAQDQPHPACEDVHPLVAVVDPWVRLRLRRGNDDLPRLYAARVTGERKHRAPVDASRFQVYPWVSDLRRTHQVIERQAVSLREWQKQLQARACAGRSPAATRVLFEMPVRSDRSASVTWRWARIRLRRGPTRSRAAEIVVRSSTAHSSRPSRKWQQKLSKLDRRRGSSCDMNEYDVVVIGGGAAGLSAALVLSRARRTVAVVDAGQPRNEPAAHLQGFLSRDGMPPHELLAVGRSEVGAYGGQVIAGTVTGLLADGAELPGHARRRPTAERATRAWCRRGCGTSCPHPRGRRALGT